jgi:hypothetical protein
VKPVQAAAAHSRESLLPKARPKFLTKPNDNPGKSTPSQIPFDELTRRIVQGDLKPEDHLNSLRMKGGNQLFWWPLPIPPQERNLKSIVPYQRLLDREQIESLFWKYVDGLLSVTARTQMRDCMDKLMHKRLSNQLDAMEQGKVPLSLLRLSDRSEVKILDVDLFNIDNTFCVGADCRRHKNLGPRSYHIYDRIVNGVLTRHYIRKRLKEDEKARIIMHFDLSITLNREIFSLQDPTREDLKNEGNPDTQQISTFHHLRLECECMETDYKAHKRSFEVSGPEALNHIQIVNKIQEPALQICDFDNYMGGNPLVREPRS